MAVGVLRHSMNTEVDKRCELPTM